MSFQPLAGALVLDLTGSLAGPHCTEVLGALGADVVKVERPDGGDETRLWGPPFSGGEGMLFLSANANKRSVALRLGDPGARAALLRLVAGADVVVQSLRPGLAERHGLGAQELLGRNPRLVYCSITAYGGDGPLRDEPGYDPLVQAAAGIMSVTGARDGPPVRVGVSLVDFTTGMWAALGIVAALADRERTGRGRLVETSLYEAALGLASYHLTGSLVTGREPGRSGTAFPLIVPYQAFRTRDGDLMLAAANDRLFVALAHAIDRPELAGDPRFATNPDRVEHRDELVSLLHGFLAERTTGEWLERLRAAGVPAAPVASLSEVAASPQTAALGALERELDAVAPALTVDGEALHNRTRAPRLGEHTREVLTGAGCSEDEIDALFRSGAAAE
jgi:formyl-CoA transferase/CoA:oxalate CoA-transferase